MKEETKRKISDSLKGNVPSNKGKKKPLVEYICQVCGNSVFDRYVQRKACSLICQKSLAGGYRPNSTRKRSCVYKGFRMDSGAELKFAELLDEHDIRWVKNSTEFFAYEDSSGKKRKYYPDFYLSDHDLWVEVKSEYYKTEHFDLKIESVDNIQVIWDHDIKLPNL
jgi:hypothetical protein